MVGVAATAVAVGFAPHLAKDGPLLVRAATLVLGAAGAGLTVGGTVAATRGRPPAHRIAVGAAVAVVTALVMFVVGPAVAATNVPRPEIGATPSSMGLAYESVTLLTTDDGVRLAGWYMPSTNRAAVVLLHGAGSTRSDVLDEAAVLARARVRCPDDRRPRSRRQRRAGDGLRLARRRRHRRRHRATSPTARTSTGERIGVVGMSMGGEEALGATATNELIRAVVAEGATARSAGRRGVAVRPVRRPRAGAGTARTAPGLRHRRPHRRVGSHLDPGRRRGVRRHPLPAHHRRQRRRRGPRRRLRRRGCARPGRDLDRPGRRAHRRAPGRPRRMDRSGRHVPDRHVAGSDG